MAAASHRRQAQPDPQDGLFDQVLDNELLLAALERREAAKAKKAALTAQYKEAHESACGIIIGLDLEPDTVVRCGRFRIKTTAIATRHVEFDTDPTTRLSITVLD